MPQSIYVCNAAYTAVTAVIITRNAWPVERRKSAYADRNDIVACLWKCRSDTSQVHSSMKYLAFVQTVS